MDVHLLFYIICLVFLLFLSGFFSSAETALTTVSRVKLEAMVAEGGATARRAKRVIKCTDNKPKMLSAILIGNNLVNIIASSIATLIAIEIGGSAAVGIAAGILTFLILIFGEITPKSFAALESTRHSFRVAGIILGLMWLFTPIVFILNILVKAILRLLGVSREEETNGMTSQELRMVLKFSHESGSIESTEKEYIENVFDFQDSMVREIMIPRIDTILVNKDWSFEKLISVFKEKMFTRYPVYEPETDKIIGILNMKDVVLHDPKETFLVSNYIREAYFTYEQNKISRLFNDMRSKSISMTIVLDEYGAIAGIITLEDLLEELVGEIRDEFDGYEVDDITPVSPNEFDVVGTANLDDICDELNLDFTSDDYDTIGGYLVGLFDHFPRAGEVYTTPEGIRLKVLVVKKSRIEKIRIFIPNNAISLT